MGEVVPIRSTEDALELVKDWERAYQEQELRAESYRLLYEAYKLRLLMVEKENERLRELIG